MRFGDCTYQEIAALAGQGAVAVVPPGCTEQQGPRLPAPPPSDAPPTWRPGAPGLAGAVRFPGPSRTPDWSEPRLDFGAYSDTGVIGDACHASSEIGQRLWQESVNWLAEFIAWAAT